MEQLDPLDPDEVERRYWAARLISMKTRTIVVLAWAPAYFVMILFLATPRYRDGWVAGVAWSIVLCIAYNYVIAWTIKFIQTWRLAKLEAWHDVELMKRAKVDSYRHTLRTIDRLEHEMSIPSRDGRGGA